MAEKFALLETINPAAQQIIQDSGFDVVLVPKTNNPDEFSENIMGATVVGVRSEGVPKGAIELNPQLEQIGCFCVGTKVDFEAANAHGVNVTNSLHENTRSVAEHVIGNTLALFRRTAEHNASMHAGVWTKTDERSYEIRGKTLGILGYGNIGIQVGAMADALGMDVLYHDPWSKFPPLGRIQQVDSREELLAASHAVTLHMPVTDKTRNVINDRTIQQMGEGTYLINAARGELVDYDALGAACDEEYLGGAAIDVYVDEPKKEGAEFIHPLRGRKNVIITPHIAGSTEESQRNIAIQTARRLLKHKFTGDTLDSVNFPGHQLVKPEAGESRLLYAHTDEVGAIEGITEVLKEAEINIGDMANSVRREGHLGYAYFDITKGEITPGVLEVIRNLPSHRRARVIPPIEQ